MSLLSFSSQHQSQKERRKEKDTDVRRATALLSEIIAGITLYFDKALGNNLLYRFERAQYVEQKRENPDKPMSEIYGAEHLLRLFGESPPRADRRGPGFVRRDLDSSRRKLGCDLRGELMDSQLRALYRLYQYRSRVTQYLERVHQ
jgi:mortality factor 4-like protein 1